MQSVRLVALEADDWRLASRAVHADVGDLALPIGEVRLERLPGSQSCGLRSRCSVVLDITDPALCLALSRARYGAHAED